jgi:hypothetical protein
MNLQQRQAAIGSTPIEWLEKKFHKNYQKNYIQS